jgi:GntR family transcriptional regulator
MPPTAKGLVYYHQSRYIRVESSAPEFSFNRKRLDTVNLLYILCLSRMFLISQTDKRAMYLQIMEQIKQRIAVGDWAAGQAIPSIRQLAVDISVSVITVKRAYLELEREGVIVKHQGRGSFVASDSKLGTRIREQELARHLEQAVRSAALLGLSPKDLEKRIRASYDRVTDAEKESV